MKPIVRTLLQPLVRSAIAKRNAQFEDGLYAGLAGSGSPLPDFQRVGSRIAVLAGNHFFVADAGEDITHNVLLMNLPLIKSAFHPCRKPYDCPLLLKILGIVF